MKTAEKINNLIKSGLPCELAEKVVEKGLSLSKVKKASKSGLLEYFTEAEAKILFALKRKPIPKETIDKLFSESAGRCCLCWQWKDTPPLIIHHIVEHSKTQDDSYENLVLLCLNHHAEVHTVSKLSRQNQPPNYVRSQKTKWIQAVTEYQAGRRPTPGSEKTRRIYKPTAPSFQKHFVGREKPLQQIVNALQHEGPSVLAITGMGGVGKTSLAKKVVEQKQVRDKYEGGIFWASLTEVNGKIMPIFLTWALICGNEVFENQDILDAVDLAYLMRNTLEAYVAEHGHILIVIDDVREEYLPNAALIQKVAPQDCSILLTARSREIATSFGAHLFNLEQMVPKDAFSMLVALVESPLVKENATAAKNLLKELGHLPLAVELAGKRINLEQNKPGFSLESFLESVISRGADTLIIKGHAGLARTFSITYDNLPMQSQTVFRQTSIFVSNLISVESVCAITDLDLQTTTFILDDMVMQSLLQWGYAEGEYIIHPLLKQFAAQLLLQADSQRATTQNRYVNFILDNTAKNAQESTYAHRELDRIWPDIQQAFSFAVKQKDHKTINHFANTLWRDTRFLYVRGYIEEASYILSEAVRVCSKNGWKKDQVSHLIHIGTAYSHLGKTIKSLNSYQAALDINQHLQDPQTDAACLGRVDI